MAKKQSDALCAHCEHATVLTGTPYCVCALCGPVDAAFGCSRFQLDVFKLPLTPPPPFTGMEKMD